MIETHIYKLRKIALTVIARRLAVSMGYDIALDLTYTEGARFVITGI